MIARPLGRNARLEACRRPLSETILLAINHWILRHSDSVIMLIKNMLATVATFFAVQAVVAGLDSHQEDAKCVDLVTRCGADPDGATDSSAAFIACQSLASPTNGGNGCVTVPDGRFRVVNVVLNASNIVWVMSGGTLFLPAPMTQAHSIFVISTTDPSKPIVNITFMAPWPHKFTVDISKPTLEPWNVRAFSFAGPVHNATLTNLLVKLANPAVDHSITIQGTKSALEFDAQHSISPSHFYVANITTTGGVWGYGTTQVQALRDSVFENIDGTGGATLRLETGAHGAGAVVTGIVARNIICRNGHSAVLAGPHCQKNGDFHIYNVSAYSCNNAVSIGQGYVDPNKPNCTEPGVYSNSSTVTGVLGVFGRTAQVECKANCTDNWPACMPCDIGTPKIPRNWVATVTDIVAQGYPKPSNRTQCMQWNKWAPSHCYYNNTASDQPMSVVVYP